MIEMRLAKVTQVHGLAYAAGDRVFVDTTLAADMLQTGRARLVDAADLALLVQTCGRDRPIVGRFSATRSR